MSLGGIRSMGCPLWASTWKHPLQGPLGSFKLNVDTTAEKSRAAPA